MTVWAVVNQSRKEDDLDDYNDDFNDDDFILASVITLYIFRIVFQAYQSTKREGSEAKAGQGLSSETRRIY